MKQVGVFIALLLGFAAAFYLMLNNPAIAMHVVFGLVACAALAGFCLIAGDLVDR